MSIIPLDNSTNDTRILPATQQFEAGPLTSRDQCLRRRRSLQAINHCVGSSESFPDKPDSVFDAEPISSEDDAVDQRPQMSASENRPLSPINLQRSHSYEDLAVISDLGSSLTSSSTFRQVWSSSHETGPPAQLDTIIERNSFVNTSPRLSTSPGGRPTIVHPAHSIHSIRPKYPPGPRGPRSFSMDDLDCFKPSKTPCHTPHEISSSSTSVLDLICACPAMPNKPSHPPPQRVPTPDGLPKFGTREALEYRFSSQSNSSLRSSIFGSRPGHRSHPISPNLSSGTGSPDVRPRNPPMDMLKRVLGFNQVVNYPPPSDSARASLPANLQALARAADGTLVRGVWGSRMSGHGVGNRPLDRHPIVTRSRNEDRRTLDEVAEIDKACEAAQLRDSAAVAQLDQQGRAATQDAIDEAIAAVDTIASRDLPRPRSGGRQESADAAVQQLAISNELGSRMSGARRTRFVDESAADVRPAAGPIAPSVLLSPPTRGSITSDPSISHVMSPRSDGIDGIRDFIVHGERASAERLREVNEKQEQHSSLGWCMIWFCKCCCELDYTDEGVDRRARGRFVMESGIGTGMSRPRPLITRDSRELGRENGLYDAGRVRMVYPSQVPVRGVVR